MGQIPESLNRRVRTEPGEQPVFSPKVSAANSRPPVKGGWY